METNRKLYWGAQILGWTGYSLLIYFSVYIDKPIENTFQLITQLVFMTFFCVFFTHCMRWFMLRKNWLNKRFFALIPRLIIISIICAFLIESSLKTVEYFLLDKFTFTENIGRMIINVLAITLLVICWNGIYYTFHFFQKSNKHELANLSLEASKNEIELKNLRSQLNPHFLFNSLNSIRALIDIQPQDAKHAVTSLSNLLRSSLLSGKENLIPLSEEVEIVKSYLELEKIRFEERLNIEWELDPNITGFQLPPFSIQMLVENAIKHGISKEINGGVITIKSMKSKDHIFIIVENTGTLGSTPDTGIGISNTKRRLAIQYNGKADFSLYQNNAKVVATLKFEHENN